MDDVSNCKMSSSGLWRKSFKLSAAFVAAFFLFVLDGCSGVQVSESTNDSLGLPPLVKSFSVKRQRQFVLPINAKFYVPTPVWTFQKERVNPQELSSALAQAVSARFPNVVSSGAVQDMAEAIKQARSKSANFVLYVRPNDWHQRVEDNPAAARQPQSVCGSNADVSSGVYADDLVKQEERCQRTGNINLDRARADLTIWLIDAPSGQVMDLITVNSKSGLLPISSGTASSLLKEPFAEVVARFAPASL